MNLSGNMVSVNGMWIGVCWECDINKLRDGLNGCNGLICEGGILKMYGIGGGGL